MVIRGDDRKKSGVHDGEVEWTIDDYHCTFNVVWGWTRDMRSPIADLVCLFLLVLCNLFSRLLCASRSWSDCYVYRYVLNARSECENDNIAYSSYATFVTSAQCVTPAIEH